MSESQKVIDIALAEVGYIEKASNKNLENKTANSGRNNYNKYARDLDNISGFYNGKKNGYDWCDIFVDWSFVKAVGVDRALELLCQPRKSTGAGCYYSMGFYKAKGQLYSTPKVGDQIFFGNGDDIYHTGLVYKVDKSKVYTIEGNTSKDGSGYSNMVAKKSYPLGASYIGGYGRPDYKEEKEEKKVETKKTYSGTFPKLPLRGYFYYDAIRGKVKDKGTQAKNLQKFLNWATGGNLVIDGSIGPLCHKAILKYQEMYGLEKDGFFGPKCLKKAKEIKR